MINGGRFVFYYESISFPLLWSVSSTWSRHIVWILLQLPRLTWLTRFLENSSQFHNSHFVVREFVRPYVCSLSPLVSVTYLVTSSLFRACDYLANISWSKFILTKSVRILNLLLPTDNTQLKEQVFFVKVEDGCLSYWGFWFRIL